MHSIIQEREGGRNQVIGRRNPYTKLEKQIGYRFRNRSLLETALTHRSYRFEQDAVETDNQRLEYLGDAVLGLLPAAHLNNRFKDSDEGVLTPLRSQTTSGKALAQYARDLELGEHLLVGSGEDRSGGRNRSSNLADALEAVIGAVYIDGGIKGAEKLFKKIFVPRLEALSGNVWEGNPKGQLQAFCQQRWKQTPAYEVIRQSGPQHAAEFTVRATIDKYQGRGRAHNKREAEMKAAEHLLKQLHQEKDI
jgi:ribonuclease-3